MDEIPISIFNEDSCIQVTCDLEALKHYLESKNWSLIDSTNGALIYQGPLDDLQRPIRVVLPDSTEYVDTSSLIAKVLKLLSVLERRPIKDICRAIRSTEKHLRKSYESQDTMVIGKIVQLRDSKMGEEEIEDLEHASSNGIITIEWEGKSCRIRAHLPPEEYKIACDAHRDGKTISIKGKPEKLGKYFILTTPSEFKIC